MSSLGYLVSKKRNLYSFFDVILIVLYSLTVHWGIFRSVYVCVCVCVCVCVLKDLCSMLFPSSVPAFKNEWYWKRLMDGTADYVEFHNRVYGCSGVKPDKFPCTGPNFT